MFSKMARSMLRGIRVATKEELIQRIHQYFEEVNADPVLAAPQFLRWPSATTCRRSRTAS